MEIIKAKKAKCLYTALDQEILGNTLIHETEKMFDVNEIYSFKLKINDTEITIDAAVFEVFTKLECGLLNIKELKDIRKYPPDSVGYNQASILEEKIKEGFVKIDKEGICTLSQRLQNASYVAVKKYL